ncbi:hypothetical protein [Flavobacterium poyangense]|uniref:hypothetical protein n=1 Tax=Flavobacterium poyangense TaxID=2204302 RepID=UPI00141FB1FD|nr:hypothetical protein [Flavobacterium sp. JXAS1]
METSKLNPVTQNDEMTSDERSKLIIRDSFELNINSMIQKANKDPFYAAARLLKDQTDHIEQISPFVQWKEQRKDKIERFNKRQQDINNSKGSHDLEWGKLKAEEFIPNILEISDEKYKKMVAGWVFSGLPYGINSVVSSSLNPLSYIPFVGVAAQATAIPSAVISASESILAKYLAKAADDSSTAMKIAGRQVLMPEIASALSAGESNEKFDDNVKFMSIELDNLKDIDSSSFEGILDEINVIRNSQKMTSERLRYGMVGGVTGVPNAALSFAVSTGLGLIGIPSVAATLITSTYGWATGSGLSEAAQQDYGMRLRTKHCSLDPEQPFQARKFYMSGTENKLTVIKSMTDNSIIRNQIRLEDLNKKKYFFEKWRNERIEAISKTKLSRLEKLLDNISLLERAYDRKRNEIQCEEDIQLKERKKIDKEYITESARLQVEFYELEKKIIDNSKKKSKGVKISSIIEDLEKSISKRTNKVLINTKDSKLLDGVLNGIKDPGNLVSGNQNVHEVEMLTELTPGSKAYGLIDDPKKSYKKTLSRISRKGKALRRATKIIDKTFDKFFDATKKSDTPSSNTSHIFSLGAAVYCDSLRTYSALGFSYSYNIFKNRRINMIPKNVGFNRMVEAVPGAVLTNTISSQLKFFPGKDLTKIGTASGSTIAAAANQYGAAHNPYVDRSPGINRAFKNMIKSPLDIGRHVFRVKSVDNLAAKVEKEMTELKFLDRQESTGSTTSQESSENDKLLSGLKYSSAMRKFESSVEKKIKKEDKVKEVVSKKKNEDRRPLL